MRIKQVFLITCLSLMPITWHHIPMLRLLLPLLLGVGSALFFPFSLPVACALIFGSMTVYFILANTRRLAKHFHAQWIFGMVLHIPLFAFGHVLINLHNPINQSQYFMHHADSTAVFQCRLTAPPLESERSIRLNVQMQFCLQNGSVTAVNGKSIIYVRKDAVLPFNMVYGDVFLIRHIFQEPDPPKNPGAFNFSRYLQQQGIHHIAFAKANDMVPTQQREAKWQWKCIYNARLYFHRVLDQYFQDADIKTVGEAMVIGSKTTIDADMRQAYANTGTMHILAVSGLHVGILYAVLVFLLRPVTWLHKNKNGRKVMCLLLLIIIWWYACLAGLSASVNRSAVMFSFLSLGKLWERDSNTFNVLFASMFVLIVADPFCVTQAGFQLSYLAVGGILFFQPFFMRLYRPKWRIIKYVYELLTVSISAQVATLPLTLFYFHQFPNYFLVSNLLAIPISFVVLVAGLALFAFGSISVIAPFIAACFGWSMSLMNGSILAVDRLPYAVTDDIYFSIGSLCLVYACVFAFGGWLALRNIRWGIAALLFLVGVIAERQWHTLTEWQSERMVIYTTKEHPVISFQYRGKTVLFSDTIPITTLSDYQFSVQADLVDHAGAPEKEVSLLDTLGRSGEGWAVRFPWVILGDEVLFMLHPASLQQLPDLSPEVDYLCILGDPFLNLSDLKKRFPKAVLVPDNTGNYRRKRFYASAGAKNGFEVYTLDQSGAFVLEK